MGVELPKGEEEKAARNIQQAVTGWGRGAGKTVSISVDEGVLFVVLVARRALLGTPPPCDGARSADSRLGNRRSQKH